MHRPEFVMPLLDARSKVTWTDLVLPPSELKTLRQVAADARAQSTARDKSSRARAKASAKGMIVLFAGAGVAGKTLAAGALANELQRPLYRIDLSKVVSKYIGETEKNLGLLFDNAEAAAAILLFDEADALFGKRSDVKDSHDRHANIDVGYLLKRMESHPGLAILATNRRSAIDPAVRRRLRYVVAFPLP